MPEDLSILTRMEADHASALREIDDLTQWLTDLRARAGELEISIRTVRAYVTPQAAERTREVKPFVPSSPVRVDPATVTGHANGNGKSPWEGQSIRAAAVAILGRTPGQVVSAQQIAETLIAENYPFTEKPIKLQRVRETVSAVLNQHISRKHEPHIEKPEPARFILAQKDAFTSTDTQEDSGTLFAPESEEEE